MFRWFQPTNEKLIEAIKAKNEAEAQKLITKMDITELSKANNGETALILAAWKGLGNVCLQLIPKMTDQAITTITRTYGETALTLAARKGLGDVCLQLISKMTDQAINHVNKNGDTALSLATKNGFKNICDLLTNKKDNLANKSDTEKNKKNNNRA